MPGDIWPYFYRKVTTNSHALSFTIFFPRIWKEETVDAQAVNIHAPQHSCASMHLGMATGMDLPVDHEWQGCYMPLEASRASQKILNSPFGSNKVEAALSSEWLELESWAEEPSYLSWDLLNWKKLQVLLF